MNDHHHDNARAERQRLADRAHAALRDLAELDPNALELSTIAGIELRGMGYEPPPEPTAGPEGPPPVPPTK